MPASTESKNPIELLQSRFGLSWPNILAAKHAAAEKRNQMVNVLKSGKRDLDSDESGVVVFGSLARDEWTIKSDLDWALLIDGQAHPEHLDVAQEIARLFHQNDLGEPPGPTGVFGNMVFSHELVHQIGGDKDTNSNTTRRLLLLLESRPLGMPDVHTRVVRVILERYFAGKSNLFTVDNTRYRVPRFLLNDIVRFWRTMAVDFASKQRERAGAGWALRNIKLRFSRKLLFVSGLLMCFSCHLENLPMLHDDLNASTDVLVNHLSHYVTTPPLDILASALLSYDSSKPTVANLLDSYDSFIGYLNNESYREHLKNLAFADSKSDTVFQHLREMGHQFQQGLNDLFFEHNGDLRSLIKKYGVF
jgi:predicted nucleotidyltransferase